MSDSEGRLAQRRGIDGREKVVGTYSGQLVRHSASVPKAEIDALRARIRELEAQLSVYEGARLSELLARVRELEAQAARDKAVVEAARGGSPDEWRALGDVLRGWDYASIGQVMDDVAAALAAREVSDYRAARGCLPMAPDAEPSEVVIRRFRGG